MKNNEKKGFTFIEILAVIVILGIITTIVVVAVSKYTKKTKNEVYDNYIKNIKTASNNYILKNNNVLDYTSISIDINELIKNNYLDELIDPNSKDVKCGGYVIVSRREIESSEENEFNENGDIISSNTNNIDFDYKVCLTCPSGYKSSDCE